MATFSQKADAFRQAQARDKDHSTPASRRALAETADALKQSPEAAAQRRATNGQAQQQSASGSKSIWRR